MATTMTAQAHFSLLTWLPDPARGERKNVAVLLATDDGHDGTMRALSLGTLSERIRDQGVLSHMLDGLRSQFAAELKPTVAELRTMHDRLNRSIQLTEPQPTSLVGGLDATLQALFKAYVAARGGSSKGISKGELVTKTLGAFTKSGFHADRNRYLGDFEFDLVVDRGGAAPVVLEVLSFANARKEWRETEQAVGHFLYGLGRVEAEGRAVIQPPSEISNAVACRAHERTLRWLQAEEVPIFDPTSLRSPASLLAA